MQFGVLGELVVGTEGGTKLHVGGARQRALLCLLLLRANQPVSTDTLGEELWPDRPASGSPQALKVAVSRLRGGLLADGARPIAERLVTRDRGYLLRVEPGELDAAEFESELTAARAALDQGDRPLALTYVCAALSRWRGPALDEFRDQDWARLEAMRLEELQLEALELRIGVELWLGRHTAVLSELKSLVAGHPEREQLQAHLMLALYRSGRQVDALTAFRTARRHLVDEYGVEPGPTLRDLHDAILAQDPALIHTDPADEAATGSTSRSPRVAENQSNSLTSRLRVRSSFAFVGRETEYATIARVLNAEEEPARGVLIAGEAGIGKTRLVSELAGHAHRAGMTVTGGRCDADLGIPYQPFVEALDDLLERAQGNTIARVLERHGAILSRMIPRLFREQIDLLDRAAHDQDGAHYRLFAAVADLLAQVSAQSPVILVLEDLHWADESTVLLLKHLLTMPSPPSATIIATYRSTDLDGQPLGALLPELHRDPGILRMMLGGLTESEIEELVLARDGNPSEVDAGAIARRLRHDTAGNPFFLVQLLQSDGAPGLERSQERPGDERLPLGLRETIAARIARLGERATEILVAAAVIGDEFELRLLRELGAVSEAQLLSGIEAAIDAHLLLDSEGDGVRLAFVHALVPHVLRTELTAGRRLALHRRIAEAMEQCYGEDGGDQIAALAHHWRNGSERPDVEPALRCARLAGDSALDRLAPSEAARWYQDALDLCGQQRSPSNADRCELLIALGQAQRESGQAGFRETLLEAAHLAADTGDSDHLVQASLANTRGFTSATGEIDHARVEMIKVALRSLGVRDGPERARLLAAHAVELVFCGEREEPRELSAEALAIARRGDDDSVLAQVLRMRFFAIWVPETLPVRLAESAENVRICKRLGDPLAESQALHWRANACLESGDMDAARHCTERVSQLSGRLREPTVMWQSAYNDANLALAQGQLDRAEQLALRALELGQGSAQPDALPVFAAQLASLRFDQGRMGELIPLIEQTLTEHSAITGFRAVLALAHCEEEQFEQARVAMAYDAERRFTSLAYDVTWLSVMCIYAHVAARLGDTAAARTLHDCLLPWRDQVAVSVVAWGCVSHYLGMLAAAFGDRTTALDHLAYALEVHERMHAPIWSMRTRLEKARIRFAEHANGTSRDVRTLAAQADELGCGTIHRDAVTLLEVSEVLEASEVRRGPTRN